LWQLIAIIWQKQKRRWQIKQSKFTTKLLHNNRNAVIYWLLCIKMQGVLRNEAQLESNKLITNTLFVIALDINHLTPASVTAISSGFFTSQKK
jgi:hypothetical protein